MAVLTRKEFQDLTGKNKNYINTYIVRGKIVVEDNMIDTENVVNAAFIESLNRKSVVKEKVKIVKAPKVKETKEVKVATAKNILDIKIPKDTEKPKGEEFVKESLRIAEEIDIEKNKRIIEIEERKKLQEKKVKAQVNIFSLEEEKKVKEIEKLAVDIELKNVQLSKLRGELLPYELVRDLIAQLSKNLITEFDNAADVMLTKISSIAKLQPSLVAETREFIKNANNLAQKKAVASTKKQLELVINEIIE